MAVHKKPMGGGLSAVGGNSEYTYYTPDDPKYAGLVNKLSADIPTLLPCMDLGGEPLPLLWTADYIPKNPDDWAAGPYDRTCPDEKTEYTVGEFNCSCVGISKFQAVCGGEKTLADVSDEDYFDACELTELMGIKAIEMLTKAVSPPKKEPIDVTPKATPPKIQKNYAPVVYPDAPSLPKQGASNEKLDAVWGAYQTKMTAEKLSGAAIAAFKYNLGVLTSGANLMIAEGDIEPVASLPDYNSLTKEDPSLLTTTVMVKLNGGLGTGMGLEKAKSLLDLKDGNTFLDFIAQQVMNMRTEYKTEIAFMLMNSFATSADTLEHLSKYEKLALPGLDLEFQQNKAPKVTEKDLTPASWPAKPDCEWCPPGHGDLYPAMLGTNTLDNLLAKGYKYMFVSNSDNLGATMDLKLLTWFAESGAPFAMECAARTEADKKGGHLATSKATNGLLLREAAQCPDEDEKAFQDTSKYKYFNTNNLWVDLQKLKETMDKNDGVLPLPVIKNGKTVDPRDKKSTKVLQLETAMGAAIASFEGAAAIQIPRERFAPVKTTNDMLALMSDAYMVTPDYRMVLVEERAGVPPNIKLDGIYKFVDQLQKLVPNGPPSLVKCKKLTIEGDVAFAKGVIFVGEVKVINEPDEFGGVGCKVLEAGTYTDTTVTL